MSLDINTEQPISLRFCMWSAHEAGEAGHPQEVMKRLGITYQHATPQSIADQWWFWLCTIPKGMELPKYLTKLNIAPGDAVGFGLSQKTADDLTALASGK